MVNEKINELALKICKEQGFDLYGLEFKNTDKGKVLRVFITSPNGVKLDNCSAVSRKLNNELDIIDLISSSYYLEVSSPGLERTLANCTHYKQAIGERIKVTYRKDKKTHTIIGALREVSSEGLVLENEDKVEISLETIPYNVIKKVRTVYTINTRR